MSPSNDLARACRHTPGGILHSARVLSHAERRGEKANLRKRDACGYGPCGRGLCPPRGGGRTWGTEAPPTAEPRERTRGCWTRERPKIRPHAERRGEKDKATERRGEKANLRKRDACGYGPCGRGLCPPRGGGRTWGTEAPPTAEPRERTRGCWTREGLCRAAGGRRLSILAQLCEGGSEQVWVDGREWAILAAPAILAHPRDEQVCERECPESVRPWGIEGYGVASLAPQPPRHASQWRPREGRQTLMSPHSGTSFQVAAPHERREHLNGFGEGAFWTEAPRPPPLRARIACNSGPDPGVRGGVGRNCGRRRELRRSEIG